MRKRVALLGLAPAIIFVAFILPYLVWTEYVLCCVVNPRLCEPRDQLEKRLKAAGWNVYGVEKLNLNTWGGSFSVDYRQKWPGFIYTYRVNYMRSKLGDTDRGWVVGTLEQ